MAIFNSKLLTSPEGYVHGDFSHSLCQWLAKSCEGCGSFIPTSGVAPASPLRESPWIPTPEKALKPCAGAKVLGHHAEKRPVMSSPIPPGINVQTYITHRDLSPCSSLVNQLFNYGNIWQSAILTIATSLLHPCYVKIVNPIILRDKLPSGYDSHSYRKSPF